MTAFDLIACLGHLGIALLVLFRGLRDPLGLPLALLTLDMFAWNFAAFAHRISGLPAWHWLDLALSPFSPALGFHFVLLFVGKARACWPFIIAVYAVFAALSSVAVASFFSLTARAWVDSTSWAAFFLGAEVATTVPAVAVLVSHFRRARGDERPRAAVILAALVVAALSATTEMWDDIGLSTVPRLGNLGTFVTTALISLAVLRFPFLGGGLSVRVALRAVAVALVGLGVYLAVLRWLSVAAAIGSVVLATVSLAAVGIFRRMKARRRASQSRLADLALLGRFSAQLAHDLRNPLFAVRGGVQFLREELAQGRTLQGHEELVDIIVKQVDRLHGIIDDYQRLGRIKPQRSRGELNTTVKGLLALQPYAARGIEIRTELASALPGCEYDDDLVSAALGNVVQNAVEAMPEGGRMVVRTFSRASWASRVRLAVQISDDGCGMDARAAERAFDEFFTTKARGSGIGLAFVRRVVEAHGGQVHLRSAEGRGTQVTLWLPGTREQAA